RRITEREREGERNGVDISVLPEGCISNVVSLTSPKDACTACAVSPIFGAAAESNAVWEWFLPSDYQAIIARSSSTSLDSLNFSSKKQLYLKILPSCCKGPLHYRGGTPQYWRWISLPESRFPEVAKLLDEWWFDIRDKMHTSMLSPNTNYAAYLVYKLARRVYGFTNPPPKASVGKSGEGEDYKQTVCLCMPAVEPSQQDQVVLPRIKKVGPGAKVSHLCFCLSYFPFPTKQEKQHFPPYFPFSLFSLQPNTP
ncbi:f-box protein pp2-b10, partial [Quercus suber]